MLLILIGFREGVVDIEVSPLINRLTPKLDHWIYSYTFRNIDTRYKLLLHLSPRGKSIS